MHIKIKRGLDIPILGEPSDEISSLSNPKQVALNLEPFDNLRFKLLVKVGDPVKIGQPLVENKACPGQFWASPAGGILSEVRRGLKRRLLNLVIDVSDNEETVTHTSIEMNQDAILSRMMEGGAFPYIRTRPFNRVARPDQLPRDIFVTAVESAPFAPDAQKQIQGNESFFQVGLEALSHLTSGNVHLVCRPNETIESPHATTHTISGPHPAGLSSVHIHHIAPVLSHNETVWALDTLGVIVLGRLLKGGVYHTSRVVALAGEGVTPSARKLYKARAGLSFAELLEDKTEGQSNVYLSGDPLNGTKEEADSFLGFNDTVVSVLPLSIKREPLHFFRLGFGKFSATRAYISGFFPRKGYRFTTNQHGEERAFIDTSVYKRVMPMRIPTVQLIKAMLAEDFELAEQLGLLEVAPEDFALSTFICPSKIEMVDIVKRALHVYTTELGV